MKALRGYFLIIGAALFWGVSATVARFLFTQHVEVVILTQTRITISFLLLLPAVFVFRRDLLVVKLRDMFHFVLLGLVGGLGSTFAYYYTIEQTNVATAILLQYLAPLFVLAYAAISRTERLTGVKIFVGFLSFAGCLLAVAGDNFSALRVNSLGLAAGLLAACCWGFTNVWLRRVVTSYSIWTALVYSLFFASLFSMALNPPWNIVARGYTGAEWMTFTLFAVISILIPDVLYFSGIRYLTASTAIITATMEPVTAILSAYLFLHEQLSAVQCAGAVLVLASIVMLQSRREPMTEAMA